jgi:CheY-like chemotaxis protein
MSADAEQGRGAGRCDILLVEDNPMDLDLTLRAFAREPHDERILIARDGEEALAWLPRWRAGQPRPRLVLLDLKLPRVDGLEVLRGFRADTVAVGIPIVVLSTSTDVRDLRRAYAAGASSYIPKPTDFDRFLDLVALLRRYWCQVNLPAPGGPDGDDVDD